MPPNSCHESPCINRSNRTNACHMQHYKSPASHASRVSLCCSTLGVLEMSPLNSASPELLMPNACLCLVILWDCSKCHDTNLLRAQESRSQSTFLCSSNPFVEPRIKRGIPVNHWRHARLRRWPMRRTSSLAVLCEFAVIIILIIIIIILRFHHFLCV